MNLLSIIYVANIFCHFVTCLFTLFMMPLDAHRLLILILLDLSVLSFMVNTLCSLLKKFFPVPGSLRYSPVFCVVLPFVCYFIVFS